MNLSNGRNHTDTTTSSLDIVMTLASATTLVLPKEDTPSVTHGTYRRGNSPAGWRSAPALSPKMRRGLSVLLVAR
jgi:hypothetical protein